MRIVTVQLAFNVTGAYQCFRCWCVGVKWIPEEEYPEFLRQLEYGDAA